MKDPLGMLASLRRPGLLIRAARHGAKDYRRHLHLPRVLGSNGTPRNAAALMLLLELEQDLNSQREERDAGYSLLRHVDVMIAMMGEAQLLRASHGRV